MDNFKAFEVTLAWQDLNVYLPQENSFSISNLFKSRKNVEISEYRQILQNGNI
jgi:hypothetical protein